MLARVRLGRRDTSGLLIDLDGVLHVGRRPIAGAVDQVAALRALGIPHGYVTNTTTRPVAELSRELSQMGFAIEADSILSAPMAAKSYLESLHNPRCKLLLRREVLAEFGDCRQSEIGVDVVVVGDIGAAWSHELLNGVFRLLMDGAEPSLCIAIASGRPRMGSKSTSEPLLQVSSTPRERQEGCARAPSPSATAARPVHHSTQRLRPEQGSTQNPRPHGQMSGSASWQSVCL